MHYPQSAVGVQHITYPVMGTVNELLLTASGSANVKGSYAQLTSSMAFTSKDAWIVVTYGDNAVRRWLFDVATGAGGAEVVQIANVHMESTNSTTSWSPHSFHVPFEVTSGTRVAMRVQCSTGSQQTTISITFQTAGDTPGIATFATLGATTASSQGTNVDPGGSANTKGSYVQMIASSAALTQFIMLTWTNPSGNRNYQWAMDIATGAGGAEVVLIPDVRGGQGAFIENSAATAMHHHSESFLTYIPASTRIAVRCSCDGTVDVDRDLDMMLFLGTAPTETAGSGLKRHPGMAGGMAA